MDVREYPWYIECTVCGYRKWCKELKNGWICRSCTRIEKEKKNAKL